MLYKKGHFVSDEIRKKISKANKGKKRSEETKRKISEYKKGRKLSEETKRKMRLSKLGNKNPQWKKKITYRTLHEWINRNYGKANKCSNSKCKKTSICYDWALIRGKKYKRNINNFIQFCRICHHKYDLTPTKKAKMLKKLKDFNKKRNMLENVCKVCYHKLSKHLYFYPKNICIEKRTNGESCNCHIKPNPPEYEKSVESVNSLFGNLFKQAK